MPTIKTRASVGWSGHGMLFGSLKFSILANGRSWPDNGRSNGSVYEVVAFRVPTKFCQRLLVALPAQDGRREEGQCIDAANADRPDFWGLVLECIRVQAAGHARVVDRLGKATVGIGA